MPIDGNSEDNQPGHGGSNRNAQVFRDNPAKGTDQYRGVRNAITQRYANPLRSDPNYKSVRFGERRRLKKEQAESSERFNEQQDEIDKNQHRSRRNINARFLRNTRPKIKKSAGMTKKVYAKGRVLLAAGQISLICAYVYIVQVVGFAIQLGGLFAEAGAEQFYLGWLDLGISVFMAGWVISIISGMLTIAIMAGTFMVKRVQIFNIYAFVSAIVFALLPFNPIPVGLLWLAIVVYTAGD